MTARLDRERSSPGRPVVVVGDVGVDILVRPHEAIRHGDDTRATMSMLPGGAGGNTAAWLAANGAMVSLLARVGRDPAGDSARISLQRNNVRAVLAEDPERTTCCVVVLVDEAGERTMLSDRGANQAFCADDLDWAQALAGWRGVPHVHVSGYVLFDEGSRAAGLAALAHAREQGWTTSVDPQVSALLEQVGVATFLSWVSGVDLLLPNLDELTVLGGPEAVLAAGVGACVVTLGPHGARWISREVDLVVPAPAVEVRDTTGAGDAFDAGLLAAWVRGATPEQALRAGVAAGSAAAGLLGAGPSL